MLSGHCTFGEIFTTMLRFVFYLIFGYFILRLIKVMIDPLFDQRPAKQSQRGTSTHSGHTTNRNNPKPGLGEYVEFEEIK